MMENDRIKNSTRNILFGVLKYLVTIIFPFIIRTVLINKLGTEYAGISSLFSSVLQVLSLSELGFSTAVVFALYEPITKNETVRICKLLSFFRSVYRICGLFIIGIGLILCPFINSFISGSYPKDINIYIIFILLLLNTGISYLICGYKSVLFTANQRDDILSRCYILSNIIMYSIQLVILVTLSNYYIYIVCILLGTVIHNVLLNYYSNKLYPSISCKGKLETSEKKALFKSVGSLFGHQIDTVILNSADNIVISMFLGLNVLTIYNNYYLILNSLLSVLLILSNSFAGSIGNSIAIESKEKNFKNFIDFTYFIGLTSAISTILMLILYQDFMKIWMGEDMLLESGLIVCLCVSFFARQFRRSLITYKIAAGIWSKDALKPYVACFANLVLNIILVRYIGLYGVIISTIISILFIETPWEVVVFFKEYFKGGVKKYLWTQIKIVAKMVAVGFVAFMCSRLLLVNNIWMFIAKAFVFGFLVVGLFVIISYKDVEFKYIIDKIKYVIIRFKG